MAEYINREKLFKDIEDSVRFSTRNGVSAELRGAHKIVDRIRSAPAAEVVEVVHGYWKGIELKDTCSACNRSISEICDADSWIEEDVLSELIACPFCGAKMDGERRSE